MIDSAAGFVLAGGRSRRMGRDKALLPFAGEPLIVRAVEILRRAALRTAIAGGDARLTAYSPVIEDRTPSQGPLGGICAALESIQERWGVFIPVDVPLLPPELIACLLHHAQMTGAAVTMASVAGSAQTFPVVLDRAALPALRAELDAGRLKCISAFAAAAAALGQQAATLPVESLLKPGEINGLGSINPAQWFLNVNTPDELRNAEALASRRIA